MLIQNQCNIINFKGNLNQGATPTWKQINIYEKYASSVPAFPQSTICCLIKNKKDENFLLARFFFNVGLKIHGQNRLFKGVQNQNNQISNAKLSGVIIQTCRITENTMYLFDKKILSLFQTYFVFIFHVKS